jgi:hypothetical protein
MNISKFGIKSKKSFMNVQNIESEYDNQEIDVEYVLYTLVKQQNFILKKL